MDVLRHPIFGGITRGYKAEYIRESTDFIKAAVIWRGYPMIKGGLRTGRPNDLVKTAETGRCSPRIRRIITMRIDGLE